MLTPSTRIMQLLSAPEGPSRVARDASPWFVTSITRQPRRGDINLRCGVCDVALRSCLVILVTNQGLASLATRLGPSGADSSCIILVDGVSIKGYAITAESATSAPVFVHVAPASGHFFHCNWPRDGICS